MESPISREEAIPGSSQFYNTEGAFGHHWFRAMLVAQVMAQTLVTLGVIEQLAEMGLVEIDGHVMIQDVIAKESTVKREAKIIVAPVQDRAGTHAGDRRGTWP